MPRKYRLGKLSYVETPVRVEGDRAAAYKKAALEAAQQDLDLALVVITEADRALFGAASPYYTAKATLMSQGVASPAQAPRLDAVTTEDRCDANKTLPL